ncbi:MAG: DinB family protein [Gracilimonas sp.]|uniref:DinB family protein n=1 Tax=Gracilimonas sp. TaxID=1974203 RepID=UPI0019C5E53F|nr:DinB family protein [Gracilimonas sp.]MBD3616192.1 DinB family protein [Gracilimonas sp.]
MSQSTLKNGVITPDIVHYQTVCFLQATKLVQSIQSMKDVLLLQFDLHQRLYNNVLDGFTDEETNRRPHGDRNMNHVKYLAGHLLNSRYGLTSMTWFSPEVKWNDLFAVMGQSEAKDDIPYPSIEEIKKEWNILYEPTRKELEKLTADSLAKTPLAPFDKVAESKGKLWAFINHHQAYHIGQISILRKAFAKKPMSYE